MPIQSGGNFSANFSTKSLAAGSYTITYAYAGANNISPVTATTSLLVTYAINSDATLARSELGSTIPVKIEVKDANNQNVTSTVASATATGIALASSPNTLLPLPAGSSPGGKFTGNPFTLSLKTTGLASGTYLLYFILNGDPITHSLPFKIA